MRFENNEGVIMHIVTCFKVVPEEQDIVVTPDGKLSFDRAEAKISQFDLNGIEAAVVLAGEGDKVTALSVGGKYLENTKLRKDVLSRGPAELVLVKDQAFEGALADVTASAIAAAAKTTGFDLLVFGEGSGDLYAQQVGLLAAGILGIPCVNAVTKIEKADGKVIVERSLENEIEVIELPLPAAVCVTSDINVPRIPTMKAILGAGRKPTKALSAADVAWTAPAQAAELENLVVPPRKERAHVIVEGDSPEAVADFAAKIKGLFN